MKDWGSVAQWTAVAATLLATVVALFKEEFQSWWRRPKLVVMVRLTAPDSDKIPIQRQVSSSPPTIERFDCYFLRLWIQNDGNSRAEKVQVFVAKLLRKDGVTDTYSPMGSFLPMNLHWGHENDAFADISSGMGRHCNLLHVTDPDHRNDIGESHPDAKAGQTVISLNTEMKPTNNCYLLPPGTYRLELLIAGANCPPKPHTVEVRLSGEWHEDKERMFREGLSMQLVSNSSLTRKVGQNPSLG